MVYSLWCGVFLKVPTKFILYEYSTFLAILIKDIKTCARLIYPDIDYLLLCSYCYGNNLCIQILIKIAVNV